MRGVWVTAQNSQLFFRNTGSLPKLQSEHLLRWHPESLLTLQSEHLLPHQSTYDIASQHGYFQHRGLIPSPLYSPSFQQNIILRETVSLRERPLRLEWDPAPSSSRSVRFYDICKVQQAVSESTFY
jgi:hypothetical protein